MREQDMAEWSNIKLFDLDKTHNSYESPREFLGLQGDQFQSILKEISPEYSLKGLMLKLKL